MKYRIEKDYLGEKLIDKSVLYGIHTIRAQENFEISNNKVNIKLIYAIVMVKKAAAMANELIGLLDKNKAKLIIEACDEILLGKYDESFITNALQGGAGTSTNMNVNEVIANVALKKCGKPLGSYDYIHPLNEVNLSQSTNDVYPTALRIAAIKLLRELSDEFAKLQEALQQKENEFTDIIKLGRTQLMDALPITLGQEFGAYSQAIARDRWRLYKVEERLRQINLGGTAIGTGMNAEKKYIFAVTEFIRQLTGIGLARSEFPIDITQNNDVFVEVSGLLKASAINLIKISNDLRLMNSGPRGGFSEIKLPEVQAGSSIMPGKVNPVILEMVIQTCIKVISADTSITTAASYGQFELNAFLPLISDELLNSLELLKNSIVILREKCINGIVANKEICEKHLLNSTSLVTALINYIGYDEASSIAKEALEKKKTIKEIVLERKLISEEKLEKILNYYQVTKPGIPGK